MIHYKRKAEENAMLGFFKADGEKGKNGKLWIILIGAAVGVGLLLLGASSEKTPDAEKAPDYELEKDELIIYQNHLEAEIKTLCESVSGVKNVTVAVTLSGSFESIYATEWNENREEYVIIGSGSSATALYLTRSAPTISGIGIVCTGGGSDRVRNELIPLLSATFSVSSNRIYITEGK